MLTATVIGNGSIDPKPAGSSPAPVPAAQSATRKKKASQ